MISTLLRSIVYIDAPNSLFVSSFPSVSLKKRMNYHSLEDPGDQNSRVGSSRLCLKLQTLTCKLLKLPPPVRLLAYWSFMRTSLTTSLISSPSLVSNLWMET